MCCLNSKEYIKTFLNTRETTTNKEKQKQKMFLGCDGATITSTYTYPYGAYGCYTADVTSSYIYNYGLRGGYYATLRVYAMYAYGYLAFQYADVEPNSSKLYIYAYGRYAGYYSDVFCYDGDYCYIYCGTNYGCSNMDFYCYSGATCYYDCSEDEVCPTLYSGLESDVSTSTMSAIKAGSTVGLTPGSRTDMTDDEINEQRKRKAKFKKEKVEEEKKTGLMDEDTVRTKMEASMNHVISGINRANDGKLWNIEKTFGFWPIVIVATLTVISLYELLSKFVWKGNLKTNNVEYQPIIGYQT